MRVDPSLTKRLQVSVQNKFSQPSRLIYLPGMDGTGDLFYRQATRLESSCEVTSLTLNQVDGETWEDLAEWVCTQLEAKRPAILCGESFGACLALLVATRRPDCCAGLILVNPASSFKRRPWLQAMRGLLPFVPDPFYALSTTMGLQWLAELSRIHSLDQRLLARAVQSVSKQTSSHRLGLMGSFDVDTLPLQDLRMPVVLLASGRDRLLPSVDEANRLAERLPYSHVEILPYSGHACLLEQDLDLRVVLEKHQMLGSLHETIAEASCRKPDF